MEAVHNKFLVLVSIEKISYGSIVNSSKMWLTNRYLKVFRHWLTTITLWNRGVCPFSEWSSIISTIKKNRFFNLRIFSKIWILTTCILWFGFSLYLLAARSTQVIKLMKHILLEQRLYHVIFLEFPSGQSVNSWFANFTKI